jgi:RHS repeat-associated protein
MRLRAHRLLACLLCCGVGLVVSPAAAPADASSPEGSSPGGGGGSFSPLSSSLVTPGALTGVEQVRAQEEALRNSPTAVAVREASRTKFERLDDARARQEVGAAFPALIDQAAGGAPRLASGETIVGYPSDYAAQLDLPEGRRGVLESLAPIAIEISPGRRAPIDLGLHEVGTAFQPRTPDVGIRIPKRLGEGVSLRDSGVSLTPVDATGTVLGGSEGVMGAASVFFANTQTDADTVVKPTSAGFEVDSLLRSIESPGQVAFRVGLPEGARLAQAGAAEPVQVLDEGAVIATVPAPRAWDAAGTAVPVSMHISSGNTLVLTIDRRSGQYQYPIAVDPTVVDKNLEALGSGGNWAFATDNSTAFHEVDGAEEYKGVADKNTKFERGQYAYLSYKTQGESQIRNFRIYVYGGEENIYHTTATYMAIAGSSYEAGPAEIPSSRSEAKWYELAAPGSNGNSALYETIATSSGNGAEAEYSFEHVMHGGEVTIAQEKGPSGSFDTTDEILGEGPNALYGPRWASATSGKWQIGANVNDPGLGVVKTTWRSPNAPKWEAVGAPSCAGVQCPPSASPHVSVKAPVEGRENLPEGEDTVEAEILDPAGLKATITTKVKVDSTPPSNVTLSGLPSSHEIGDGQPALLKASAKGALAGMASIALMIDGQQTFSPSKGCSPGPCTANGEWTLNGEAYAAGDHTLKVIATDNAGNVTTEELQVIIHHAAGVAVGPGSVSPTTGELALSTTDVAVNAPGAGLTVARSYRSRHLTSGAAGPLGPQWGLSAGASETLTRTPIGGMVLTSAGRQSVFTSKGKGAYSPPPGDTGVALSEKVVGNATDFLLSESGTVTTFAVPSGGSGGLWEPSVSEGAGGTNATTFAYKTESGITEPTEELAPVPYGVSCSPTLNKGCRALTFVYAEKTTESIGEGSSEWGEYKGRLKEVMFTGYEPSSKEMKTKAVAEYAYDRQGRLRAEWNPLVSPALRTVYGYDGEGHVTALAPAGQQPWLIEHGTSANDAAPGRVLAIARPAATTQAVLKTEMEEPAPVNTAAPTLSSTTPTVGVKISVASNGTWSNSPLAYSYQWQDCNSTGKECTAIPGAVNQGYYPVSGDEGHTLAAEVVALNADGALTAASAATAKVAAGTPNTPLPEPPSVGSLSVFTIDYQVPLTGTGVPQMSASEVAKWGQADAPVEVAAVFPPDEPMGWPAKEYRRATIDYLDGRDRGVNVSSPTGGISTTEYNLNNDIVRTLSPDNRATALAAGEKSAEVSKQLDTESTYNESGSEAGTELLSTLGPQHTVELTNGTKTQAREHTVYSYNEGAPSEGGPYHLVTRMTEGAQVEGKEEAASIHTTKTSYSGQDNLGWKLRKPTSVTVDPSGLNLTRSIFYEPKTGAVTETRMPAAGAPGEEQSYIYQFTFGKTETKEHEFKEPAGIAVNSSGDVYVLDTGNSRVLEFNAEGKWLRTFGHFVKPKGIALDAKGDVFVANTGASAISEFSPLGTSLAEINYGTKEPQGLAFDSEGNLWVADTGNNRIDEFTYHSAWSLSKSFGSKGSGETEFNGPQDVALGAEGALYVTDTGNERIDEYKLKYAATVIEHVRNFGSEGSGNGQLKAPHGIATDSAGDVWVADTGNNRIDELSSTGHFMRSFGREGIGAGQLKAPAGIAIDAEQNAWVADTANNRAQEWTPNGSGYGSGTPSPHDTQTIYYSAGENTQKRSCGEHPQWANLPCMTRPAAEPEGGLPPVQSSTDTSYNVWDEPEAVTTGVRTTTNTYDVAGRLQTTATSSKIGVGLPTISEKYSETLGAVEEQSTTSEGKTKAIASHYNTLGQVSSYSDASESSTSYEYDVDGRVKTINDGKGSEAYVYSTTTGLPSELINEYGTTKLAFGAKYDPEASLVTESYPNGMNANYAYDATGKPTSLEYVKTTHCTEHCTWFSDSVVPSIHGQWLEQTSTLSHQAYSYDSAGRLVQVQSTPTGKGCTTHLYKYDEDTNRTSLTAREPGPEGKCSSEGGTEEKHTYDTADRLNDTGVSYNELGDVTALPAADTGGKEASEGLASEYYVDGQLASQKQGEQTIGYNLDPTGRTLETVATGKRTATFTNHYAGSGDGPAWTSNTSGETTRNILDVTGMLAATQSNLETPVLQLTNLHGDIIATAYLSEAATGVAASADTSEYGVPTTSLPPKYSWLGALEIPTELPSGTLNMGARSYVPQLGRFLQPDPIPGGSANAYGYTFGDPVNTTDPSGEATIAELVAGHAAAVAAEYQAKEAAELAARRAAEEAAAREIAEEAALFGKSAAYWAAGPQYAGEEEWWEEEGGEEYEYVSSRGSEGSDAGHMESGVLYQPLRGKENTGETGLAFGSTVPLCEAGAEGPCARSVPCDKCKERVSQCNKTGQHCSGKKNKGANNAGGGGSINIDRICEVAGLGGAAKLVAKQSLGPAGTAVTVACAVDGGVKLVKEIL